MLTQRAAATLLSAASSPAGLADLLCATGLFSAPVDVDAQTRAWLGVNDARNAQLAAGVGATRVLVVRAQGATPLRDLLQRIATRLGTRAPHVLWILAAVDAAGATAGIAAWPNGARAPRLACFVWEPGHILASDAETLCALTTARAEHDVELHTHWLDVLGRDALTRRFYRVLESEVNALGLSLPAAIAPDDARAAALLYASRLLFLCFLEAKGWLNGDRGFLAGRFDECMRGGGGFHRGVLLPLFFGTLNTPPSRRAGGARQLGRIPFLNGGLFARTPLERRLGGFCFPDERLGSLLQQVFQRFRFVAREDSALWSEASVDPEMLGRAFECLMAPAERRSSGAFYTPHALVARVADSALHALPAQDMASVHAMRSLRVLDPACGSGAFLVHVLERLAARRVELGDPASISEVRRDVLTRSIFGVDRDPTAVWLCELRLWLSVVIECGETDPLRVTPLPNLDRNIRAGDSLVGAAFRPTDVPAPGGRHLLLLRERYVRATGTRKRTLARALDREERRRAIAHADREIAAAHHARRELLTAQRGRDLFGERAVLAAESRRESKRLRDALRALRGDRRRLADGGALPFSFPACFADAHGAGGFHVVLGNPPWVRLHRIPGALRQQFRQTYDVFRAAPWASGASGANAARGFASQVDLAALFAERSVRLLRPGGIASLLLPVKLWHSLSAGGLRQYLSERTSVLRLEDLSESRHAFDAAVYPSLLVSRSERPSAAAVHVAVHDREGSRQWRAALHTLAFDESPGAPWVVLPPDARAAFDRLRRSGTALAASLFGAPRLGVKSGCNAAFLVRLANATRDIATVAGSDGEKGKVELSLLRPALRGDAVTPWQRRPCDEWILWTHDERGPLARLPDRARAWLRPYYGELTARSDSRGRRWWALFRVDAADASASRVVWADFGRRPRALVLAPHDPTVPLNTCYVVRCADPCDAWALAALLNSRLVARWLNALAEPARGGYRRYLGWTVGQLPVPRDWPRARQVLAAAAMEARGASPADTDAEERLLEATMAAYGLDRRDVAALLDAR
ncbi:MAG: N-6 DNA methylase [Gemmatimonadaceae bacterium]